MDFLALPSCITFIFFVFILECSFWLLGKYWLFWSLVMEGLGPLKCFPVGRKSGEIPSVASVKNKYRVTSSQLIASIHKLLLTTNVFC